MFNSSPHPRKYCLFSPRTASFSTGSKIIETSWCCGSGWGTVTFQWRFMMLISSYAYVCIDRVGSSIRRRLSRDDQRWPSTRFLFARSVSNPSDGNRQAAETRLILLKVLSSPRGLTEFLYLHSLQTYNWMCPALCWLRESNLTPGSSRLKVEEFHLKGLEMSLNSVSQKGLMNELLIFHVIQLQVYLLHWVLKKKVGWPD